MTRPIIAWLTALLYAASAQAQQEHARFDFPFAVNGREHVLTYEGTHDVMGQSDTAVKLVVLVYHGGSQNPVTYFKHMKAALDATAADRPGRNLPATTMIIAPAMIGERHTADSSERYSGKNYPYWDNGWREGAPSLSKPEVSNFDLLDGMVLHVADRFPNVKAIVHVGHSAGGQLLSRYSFGSPVHDVLRQRGIHVRYVISNPSSVLYFDRQRPDLVSGKGFIDYRLRAPAVADSVCREFNTYKYGLDGMVPYMTRRPVSAMLSAFRTRDVYLFLGTSDIDPNANGLDKDCPAMLQGRFRLERGQRYYEYLGHFFGPEIFKTKFLVLAPGVAHSAGEMFKSDAGKPIIFIDADSAAAVLRQDGGGRAAPGISAQTSQAVRVAVIPSPPFVERDEKGLYLNCDFRVENQTGERIRLTRIEVSTLDAANRISSRRFLSGQGSLSPALETLPRREIDSGAVVDIFNPFHTLDPEVPAVALRFEFEFQGRQRYDAAVMIHPVLYRPKTKLVVPVRGPFLVYDGHDYYSHHRRIDLSSPAVRRFGLTVNPVRYAYDFSPVDATRSWHRGEPGKPENWVAYNAPVYAPAAGRIVAVANDVPDNRIENGRLVYPQLPNDRAKRALGNYVLIDHGAGEFSLLAHLKANTVAVGVGDRVSQDQLVGRIGFSGDTGLHVHLHYQLADGPDPLRASSLPVYFSGHRLLASGRRVVRDGLLHTGEFVER